MLKLLACLALISYAQAIEQAQDTTKVAAQDDPSTLVIAAEDVLADSTPSTPAEGQPTPQAAPSETAPVAAPVAAAPTVTPVATQPVPLASSPSSVPTQASPNPTAVPELVPAPAMHGNPAVVSPYRVLGCSYQCISMCERMPSPNCFEDCKKTFCDFSTQAYTSAAIEVSAQSQSWSSWLIGNFLILGLFCGVGYWAKQRLFRSKKMSKKMSRRLNEYNIDTYYKL